MNRAWHVLRDANRRATYDSARALFGADARLTDASGRSDPFTGAPRSSNAKPRLPVGLFVDEGLCIGCRQCAHAAPGTFAMDDELNVARVVTQWNDAEDAIEEAVLCCPKSCIFSVAKADLPMLEWIHANQPKQRVTLCSVESMSGKGKGLEESPFVAMERFERRRAELLRDAAANAERARKKADAEAALEHGPREALLALNFEAVHRRLALSVVAQRVVPLLVRSRRALGGGVGLPSAVHGRDVEEERRARPRRVPDDLRS